MKSIILAMVLTAASDPHSLGIGLDVLTEAFAVAASRAGSPSGLRDPRCAVTGCRWDYGSGVFIDAKLLEGTLSVAVIEARSSAGRLDAAHFHEACRAIVALVRPRVAQGDRRATVEAITAGAEDPRPLDEGVTIYGKRLTRPDGTSEMRCGAAAQ